MNDLPGHLKPINVKSQWLDLLLRSNLDPTTKLVGVVVGKSCNYNKRKRLNISNISDHSIRLIINENKFEVRDRLDTLFDNGWLHDTGIRHGARKVFALTFNVKPERMKK